LNATMATKIETLNLPGANLYYEIRGSGPVLLLMPGGPADATAFRSIAGQLAPHYTVVTYDPRGSPAVCSPSGTLFEPPRPTRKALNGRTTTP
jgi:hypothetical protein